MFLECLQCDKKCTGFWTDIVSFNPPFRVNTIILILQMKNLEAPGHRHRGAGTRGDSCLWSDSTFLGEGST